LAKRANDSTEPPSIHAARMTTVASLLLTTRRRRRAAARRASLEGRPQELPDVLRP
jgi:hypothetical protein